MKMFIVASLTMSKMKTGNSRAKCTASGWVVALSVKMTVFGTKGQKKEAPPSKDMPAAMSKDVGRNQKFGNDRGGASGIKCGPF